MNSADRAIDRGRGLCYNAALILAAMCRYYWYRQVFTISREWMEVSMPKLSEAAKKKIADAVKRSWVLRRAKLATAKSSSLSAETAGAKRGPGKGRRRLSVDAKRRIAEAVKRSWAARRAGRSVGSGKLVGPGADGGILAAVERASNALRSLTLADLRPLTGRRDAAVRLEELATLASDLRRMITS